jgi:hypothetical protein
MRKLFVAYELADGTEGTARVLIADKLRFENTARANSWPVEDGPRSVAVMTYSALTRTHAIPEGTTFDAFTEGILIDAQLLDHAEDTTPDPTK